MSEKSVWITGAGSGVGAATARHFAQQGARLLLSDRRDDRIASLRDELANLCGEIHVLVGDLRDSQVAREAGDIIAKTSGRLDLLVNCVGYNVPHRHWLEIDLAEADSIIQTNLLAPFYCTKVALGIMRPQKSGSLVHISSTDGLRAGKTGGPAYTTSKHGLVALSHSVNLEESGNGIRSCVICPGGIDTQFLDHRSNPPDERQREKLLRPEDVARAVDFVFAQPKHVRIEQLTMTPFPSSDH